MSFLARLSKGGVIDLHSKLHSNYLAKPLEAPKSRLSLPK
jgi:hypothetical protein